MFDRKWIIATVVTWAVVIMLNELAYYWWKDLHPGHLFSGTATAPLQTWDGIGNTFPNGYRQAGGS